MENELKLWLQKYQMKFILYTEQHYFDYRDILNFECYAYVTQTYICVAKEFNLNRFTDTEAK